MTRITGTVCFILLLCLFALARGTRDRYKDEDLVSKTPANLIPEECENDPKKGTRSPAPEPAAPAASREGEGTEPKTEIHRVLITFKLEDDPVLKWVAAATGGITEQKDETGMPVGPGGMSEEEVSAYLGTQGTNYWFDQATLAAWFGGTPFLEQVVELVDSVYYGPSTRILILNLTNKQVAETVVGIVKFSGLVQDCTLDSFLQLEESPTGNTDDPNFKEQWGLEWIGMDGSFSSSPWNITTGDSKIVVAVIDTGIDYTHPDLKPNMWVNEGEIPDNGIDDDGNGYVDDVHGFNFVESEDKSDVMDGNSHGSHCAGIIGAEANNKVGVAGVAPDVSLMALKVLSTSMTVSAVTQAVEYAIKMKVPIISASLGGRTEEFRTMWVQQLAAINRHNILFVAAAGNDGDNIDVDLVMPCGSDQPNVICVAAAFKDGCLSGNSNYGKGTVDIVAPGSNILSTVPTAKNATGYHLMTGTSMAAPFVSGAAALILSTWKKNGQEFLGRGKEVKEILLKSAKPNSKYTDFISSGAALDVPKALEMAQDGQKQNDSRTYDSGRTKSDRFDTRDRLYSQQPSDMRSDKFDQRDRIYNQQSLDRSVGKFDRRDKLHAQKQLDRNSDSNRRDRIYSHQNDGGVRDYHVEEQFDRKSDRFDHRDQIYNQQQLNMPRDERVAYSQGHISIRPPADVDRKGFSQQVYDKRSDRFGGRDQVYSQQSHDSYPRYERVQRDRPQHDRRDGSSSQQHYHG